jgi:hypothetical protein
MEIPKDLHVLKNLINRQQSKRNHTNPKEREPDNAFVDSEGIFYEWNFSYNLVSY